MRKRPLPANAEVAIRGQAQPLLLNGGQTVGALPATFLADLEGHLAVTRAGRRRIVTRARRRFVRDLILAIVVAVGMVVAFEILMRILGWL